MDNNDLQLELEPGRIPGQSPRQEKFTVRNDRTARIL